MDHSWSIILHYKDDLDGAMHDDRVKKRLSTLLLKPSVGRVEVNRRPAPSNLRTVSENILGCVPTQKAFIEVMILLKGTGSTTLS